MLRIALFFIVALIATLPSQVLARLWLKKQGIPFGTNENDGVVPTFLAHAPTSLKAMAIGLNFLLFVALMTGIYFL